MIFFLPLKANILQFPGCSFNI